VIRFNHVSIRYGERTILKDLDWTVKRGEHWSLSGENGSGKSTLLSLVCADNPQSYACDISLFGHKRGSGESIWDIKRHIGYVSPEMHRSYKQNIPAIQIVASGLKDTIGLYVRPNEAEKEQCRKWLEKLGIGQLANRNFMEMSSGEQRLVLLARAFVKEPDLLILDEPLHGLDLENRKMVKQLVDDYCKNPDVTLIFVTHYQEELPSCINHALYLERH
jgi:molybdate transport system ATP-binding protein